MRYEKKMLILSGDGKGVVMIERSALGVKYALRTFDVDGDGLRVGIITPTAVFVREIPSGRDPSAVFYTDDTELDALHFAVFGRELVLYGATCKKMWEANVMDVLRRRANLGEPPMPEPQKLPPIAPTPDKLPLPDGTGIPQSRVAIYGDEALAENDFYTPFELAPRMKQVDSFLDAPRILDGLSPTIEKRLPDPSVSPASREAAASADGAKAEEATDNKVTVNIEASTASESEPAEATAADIADNTEAMAANITEATRATAPNTAADGVPADSDGETPREHDDVVAESASEEAAATAEASEGYVEVGKEMPWRMEAAYLSGLASRSVAPSPPRTVQKVKQRTDARKLREATFFERSRKDVDKLFASAAADGELAALLPELRWVKVRFDGHAVSVGRGNTVLCYAVAGLYEKTSPFGDKAQWLPKLKNAPTGKGYWLIFQNLINGDIVRSV